MHDVVLDYDDPVLGAVVQPLDGDEAARHLRTHQTLKYYAPRAPCRTDRVGSSFLRCRGICPFAPCATFTCLRGKTCDTVPYRIAPPFFRTLPSWNFDDSATPAFRFPASVSV